MQSNTLSSDEDILAELESVRAALEEAETTLNGSISSLDSGLATSLKAEIDARKQAVDSAISSLQASDNADKQYLIGLMQAANTSLTTKLNEANTALNAKIDNSNSTLTSQLDEANTNLNNKIDSSNNTLNEKINQTITDLNQTASDLNDSLNQTADALSAEDAKNKQELLAEMDRLNTNIEALIAELQEKKLDKSAAPTYETNSAINSVTVTVPSTYPNLD